MSSSGLKENGERKLRAVDNFTLSDCNSATQSFEKLKYDTLDLFAEVLRETTRQSSERLLLFKADIDAAFRRLPVRPEHREFAHIAFMAKGKLWTAEHFAMPFGSKASVHAWERIG